MSLLAPQRMRSELEQNINNILLLQCRRISQAVSRLRPNSTATPQRALRTKDNEICFVQHTLGGRFYVKFQFQLIDILMSFDYSIAPGRRLPNSQPMLRGKPQ